MHTLNEFFFRRINNAKSYIPADEIDLATNASYVALCPKVN